MSLFSSVASIFGASKKKKAIKAATAAQVAAQQAGIDQQNAQFGQTQANLAPWLTGGTKALGAQSDLLGLNGTGVQQTQLDALRASPLFQQLFGAGQDAVLSSASATGGLRGGNAQRSLYDAGEDTFAKVIQQQLANLGGLSSAGLGAAANQGALGAQNASQISSLLGNIGNAKATGILGSAEASQQLYAAIGNLLQDGAAALAGMPSGFGGGITPSNPVSTYAPLQGLKVDQTGGAGFRPAGGIDLSSFAQAFM
ncbi:hypothetical protein ASD89_24070 [Caulobacter sp. Root656]|nr:hypothetical protein ASD89_24070 [Caulobacter sp. Root656]